MARREDQVEFPLAVPGEIQWPDQASLAQILGHQAADAHGHADAFDRRLEGQIEALEVCTARRVDARGAGCRQPARPILRPRHRVDQQVLLQIFQSSQRPPRRRQGRAADREQFDRRQADRAAIRPVAVAYPDRGVEPVAGEIHRCQ